MALFSKKNNDTILGDLDAEKARQATSSQHFPHFATEARGYKKSEVAAFLQEIANLSAHDIEIKAFNLQFLGYKKSEVDSYLDNILVSKKNEEVRKENYPLAAETSSNPASLPPAETWKEMSPKKKKRHRLRHLLMAIVGFVLFFWGIAFLIQAGTSFPQVYIVVPLAAVVWLAFDISRGDFLKLQAATIKDAFKKSVHGKSIIYSIFVVLLSGLGTLFLLPIFLHFSLAGIGAFHTQTFDNVQLSNKWESHSTKITTRYLEFKTDNGREIETIASATDYFGQKDLWDSVHKGQYYKIKIRGFDSFLSDYSLVRADRE